MLNKVQVMSNKNKRDNKGFTLIELITVIAIILILSAIIFIFSIGYIQMANERVCNFNRLEIGKTYNIHLELDNIKYTDTIFKEFMKESVIKCPLEGEFTYNDGRIKCGIHSNEVDSDNEEDNVPYI